MAKGLYFYKLVSPYKEDITKDCKLTINEIDSNFISLKDMDIKCLTFDKETNRIILTRNSKDELPLYADLSSLVEGGTYDFNVEYNKDKGEIRISWNGQTTVIDGLLTEKTALTRVNTDSTLFGLGTAKWPLGINIVDRTGQYRPCIKYVNVAGGERMPSPHSVKRGDRYVTREYVSDYGYLYDYKGVQAISEDLHFGWRVPTKQDWDGMLNAVEPCECDRTHANTVCNKVFGKFAGKLLKSSHEWEGDAAQQDPEQHEHHEPCGCHEHDHDHCNCQGEDWFENVDDKCYHYHKEDECGEHHPKRKPCDPHGVDAFGLRILPAGYGDGCELQDYFGKRGAYWTNTMISNTDVYAKRFDANKSGVVQIAASPRTIMSLRLVKDYDGANFREVEFINGLTFHCVLMPSLTAKSGFQIWTSENVAFSQKKYCPREIEINECAFTIQLFTAEWNGFEWVKKPLQEGDSVVLFTGLEDDTYAEYRVIHGELVSVASEIYEDVYAKIQNLICEINARIDAEETARQEADEALQEQIDELREQTSGTTEEIIERIEEIEEAINEIDETISGISEDVETISGDVETLKEDLSGETEARIEADEELAERISGVSQDLADETEAREAADEALSGAIETVATELADEKEAREAADEALSGAIETVASDLADETEERIAADEALSGAVETVASDLADEISRATERENEIENRLISRGEYESVEGVLTLFTESGDAITTIQFNGNYGEF